MAPAGPTSQGGAGGGVRVVSGWWCGGVRGVHLRPVTNPIPGGETRVRRGANLSHPTGGH